MVDVFSSGRFAPEILSEDQLFRLQTRGSVPQFTLNSTDSPSFGDTISAQLGYSYMPLINAVVNAVNYRDEVDNEYEPLRDMIGYEEFVDDLIDAKNAEHMRDLKQQIDENKERRQILAQSSIPQQLISGIFDPINLFAIPFGGFTVSAATAAFRTGRGVGILTAGQEALRYPFDPLATGQEVAGNIAFSVLGGAIIGGATGAVVSRQVGALKKLEEDSLQLIKTIDEQSTDTTLLQKAIDSKSDRPFAIDKEVKVGKDGKSEPIYTTEYLQGLKKALPNERFGNEKRKADQERKGFDILADNLPNLQSRLKDAKKDLQDFEATKASFSKEQSDYVKTEFINRIKKLEKDIENGNAYNKTVKDLADNQRILSQLDAELSFRRVEEDAQLNTEIQDPLSLEKNWFTESWFYKAIPTPLKSALSSAIPTITKLDFVKLIGDSAMNLTKTKFGLATENSVYQLSKIREGEWVATHDVLRTIYKEQFGKNLYAMDIDIDDAVSRLRKRTTYHDWLEGTYTKILKGEKLTDIEKRVKSQIDSFFERWETRLRDAGIIGDTASIAKDIERKQLRVFKDVRELRDLAVLDAEMTVKYQQILDELDAQFMGQAEKVGLTEKQLEFLESLKMKKQQGTFLPSGLQKKKNNIIKRLARNNFEIQDLNINLKNARQKKVLPANEEFFFPRYWSVDKIKNNREKFAQVLTKWFTNNPTVMVTKADGTKLRRPAETPEEISRATTADAIAKRVDSTIKAITKEGADLTDDSFAFYGYGKSQHFRHRELDIPNALVTDFIETNPVQVMRIYTQRVAPKYEFNKMYGGRTIDEVLDDMDNDMMNAGISMREINKVRKNFLHSYDRVVGRVLTNPARLDMRFANMLRDLAQLNYLGSAGISSIPDAAKVLMEHELKNVFKGLYGILSDSKVRMTRKELRVAAEALEILQGDAPMKFVEDLTNNPLETGFRTKARSLFYILNGLAPITNVIKKLDGIIRQHELIEFSVKEHNGTATAKDIQYLRRYGIGKEQSREIASAGWEVSENGMYLANTDKWNTSIVFPDTTAKIIYGKTGKTVEGRYVPALFRKSENAILIDRDYIKGEMFESQAWTNPKLEGVKPLSINQFKEPEDWLNFVVMHEIMHTRNSAKSLGIDLRKKGGKAEYENKINDLALAEIKKQKKVSEDTIDKFRVAMNSGVANTVVMGTPADKPIISDGVAYIPSWIGEKFGLKEDARFRGYTRVETGLAGLPFQFFSYSFAAANKITAAMATGQAKNRAISMITSMGLAYMSLSIKYELNGTGYIWDKMSIEDKMARAFDASGLAAIYSDAFYTAMQTSLALDGPDISMGLLQPKFPQDPSYVDAFTAIGGAGPSIGYDLTEGAYKFAVEGDMKGASQFVKNLPFMRLWFLRDYVNEFGRMLQDTDESDIDRLLRNRF